jgi:hypothetical protein
VTAARVRPVSSLPGKSKNRSANEYLTQCKVCDLGVFKTQLHEWQNGRPGVSPGLVHSECIEGENP